MSKGKRNFENQLIARLNESDAVKEARMRCITETIQHGQPSEEAVEQLSRAQEKVVTEMLH